MREEESSSHSTSPLGACWREVLVALRSRLVRTDPVLTWTVSRIVGMLCFGNRVTRRRWEQRLRGQPEAVFTERLARQRLRLAGLVEPVTNLGEPLAEVAHQGRELAPPAAP